MFHLSIVTYLLLCAYVAAACVVTARRRPDLYRRTGWIVMSLLVAAVLWLAWALVHPRHHGGPLDDYTYESVGCLLAILAALYGIAWCARRFSLAPLMAILGGGWLLMVYATLIAAA